MSSRKSKPYSTIQDLSGRVEEAPHELEFTATVATWMTLIIEKDPTLPFSAAKCEGRTRGTQKRRDLTLIGKNGQVLITGEVKLPYQKDGATPYNSAVAKDARLKAQRAGAEYFFTWNVNDCVLWETDGDASSSISGQHYRAWKVVTVAKDTHLTLPSTEDAIKKWLGQFLNDLSRIIKGTSKVGAKAPDERFVEALEAALTLPIRLTFEALEARYKTSKGRDDLDRWMRDDQGWTITTDPEGIRENLERTAKFTCYALVNKLVFYEALMKRYGAHLPKLNVPEHVDTGEELRLHLEGFFADAKIVTGDYETVFGEDHASVGVRIPFYADHATMFWRSLINQIHEFDFSKLDYEVIGGIFERLISPEERHKYGQFYTRAEVVDLINSFCIRTGEEKIVDPACGGGTFLVRAYARKRELQPNRSHEQMLDELYGVDISPFACHLTTINLATRDLIEDENYPRIARADFFDVQAKKRFISLPSHVKSRGLGKVQQRDIEIPSLDAVVGNPPYVRQEDIKSDRGKKQKKREPSRGTKEFYRSLVKKEMSADFSGRSDLHCYFWPHATTFLKPNGWLCLLTSSQWLDVEYGFKLQSWILDRFKIVAVFESLDEPWFIGARVVTTATILQRCDSAQERAANTVRFVQLRRPIAEILASDGTTGGAIHAADDFRAEILGLTENASNERYRARLVSQKRLFDDGVRLGKLMRAGDQESDDHDGGHEQDFATESYYGGKWGIYLRAPELWFDLLDRFGDRFALFGELAEIRFGVKSGKDEFFYPRDCSQNCLEKAAEPIAFHHEFGVPRDLVDTGKVKLVRSGPGAGEIHPIETQYLQPEVHSLMEVNGYVVRAEDCNRLILLVGKSKSELRGQYALKYINWGESKGWQKGSTCAARVTQDRDWYDLTGHERGAMFWPMAQQYKHSVPINENDLIANCQWRRENVPDSGVKVYQSG